jgi:hypothetical protein
MVSGPTLHTQAIMLKHVSIIRIFLLLLVVSLSAAQPTVPVSFNRDIRPIMSDTCFRCHGPDRGTRMAGMRLDIREEALKPTRSKIVPIVPGDPDKSAIVQRIFETNAAKLMPPKNAHKELSSAQRETIRRWVAEGAKYEGHWAYEPLKRPEVAALKSGPEANPIDAFIRARLEKEQLRPSPEADRRTLIRRLYFDLVGLPPTPEETRAFAADNTDGAWDKLVDRLLASRAFAEKETMHWLDAVRYADTVGFHGDTPMPAWPYRDYVLRAFDSNMPFDRFTREQIAGDLIFNATTEQKVASAYNRLSRFSSEGGLQPKEYIAKYGADRVRTVSAVWLGATTGCAECHDHKFDPITAKDFYSLKAFFADLRETGLVAAHGPKAHGAKLSMPTEEQTAKLAELDQKIAAARRTLAESARELPLATRAQWEHSAKTQYEKGELAWHFQRPFKATTKNGATLKIYTDELVTSEPSIGGTSVVQRLPGRGLVVATDANPDNETYSISFKPGAGSWTAVMLEAIADESLPGGRLARGADRFELSEFELEVDGAKVPLVLATGASPNPSLAHPAMAAIDGNPTTSWSVLSGEAAPYALALRFRDRVSSTADTVFTVHLRHESMLRRATIGRFRLALSAGEHSWPGAGEADDAERKKSTLEEPAKDSEKPQNGLRPALVGALLTHEADRDEAEAKLVLEYAKWSLPELQPLFTELAKLEAERNIVQSQVVEVVVSEATLPRETRVLARGNFLDDSGPVVQPAVPAFLGKLTTEDRRANRLDLANWIVSRENPLTARVTANRVWKRFFGNGISKVLDDFGSQGEWPTHPELLDWLASEFMQPQFAAEGTHPWDYKHLVRTMVTSKTYKQASTIPAGEEQLDPDNRLLARQSRFRVDAEVVHDIALSVAGLLKEKFGGPSVFPYQPEGYLQALNFPKREYSASHGDDLYRRGLYTHWQRTFLHPSIATLDGPSREECTVTRVNSNTPLQSLVLLNDPIYVEASRVFAQQALQAGGKGLSAQIDWAFERALNRKPTAEERAILTDLHRKSHLQFKADPSAANGFIHVGEAPQLKSASPVELASMATVTRAILNLHETITRN